MTKAAMCDCGEPLVMTFHFRGKEFICVHCGRLYEFFGPIPADETPELLARMEENKAIWLPIGKALLTPGAWHSDCERCMTTDEYHIDHATDEEKQANEEAKLQLAAIGK